MRKIQSRDTVGQSFFEEGAAGETIITGKDETVVSLPTLGVAAHLFERLGQFFSKEGWKMGLFPQLLYPPLASIENFGRKVDCRFFLNFSRTIDFSFKKLQSDMFFFRRR
jgi:hypothetical protein